MQEYNQALEDARGQGYLVTGVSKSWLGCEVTWRRYCRARRQPALIVSRRSTRAYVYLFMRNVPHANRSDEELENMVRARVPQADENEKIRVIRGVHGKPDLFLGLCVENLSQDRALDLAPHLLSEAHSLMLEEKTQMAGRA